MQHSPCQHVATNNHLTEAFNRNFLPRCHDNISQSSTFKSRHDQKVRNCDSLLVCSAWPEPSIKETVLFNHFILRIDMYIWKITQMSDNACNVKSEKSLIWTNLDNLSPLTSLGGWESWVQNFQWKLLSMLLCHIYTFWAFYFLSCKRKIFSAV